MIEPLSYLNSIDFAVFAFILLLMLGAGFYGQNQKENHKANDFISMGRKLTLPLFTMTLVATWYGGILGVTQMAFEYGIYSFITQGLFWYMIYLIFAFAIVDRIRKKKASTLPEFLGQAFGRRSRKLGAILNFFNLLPIAYCLSIGIFLQTLMGWDLWIGTLAGTLFVMSYSLVGGFRSVVYSDVIQFFVMFLAVILLASVSAFKLGGWNFLSSKLPATHFNLMGNSGVSSLFIWGLIAIGTLVDPNFYQRCFAAESTQVAKRGILIATVIWVVFDLAVLSGALYARASLPNASSNQAYLEFALMILPSGFRGFFLAGIVATILSTLDSFLFLCSTTLSYDLIPSKKRNRRIVQTLSMLGVGILSVIFAALSDGKIETIWITLGSISTGALLMPMSFYLLLKWEFSDNEFSSLCITSCATMGLWSQFGSEQIPMLYLGISTSLLGIFLISLRKELCAEEGRQ